MCFIKGKNLNVLYDSGATYSFVSNYCVQHLNLSISFLKTSLDCSLFIKNRKFLVNLVCLPLSQLNVILGTNWISFNQVLLNCAEKLVIFPT